MDNSLQILEGQNILDISSGIIAHQANCRGRMGAGLALQIIKKYPQVYEDYHKIYEAKGLVLGSVTYTQVNKNLWIANLMAQDSCWGEPPLTDYDALASCLTQVYSFAESQGLNLYLPYGIGCGLAGGDWAIISKLIKEHAPNARICKLKE